VRHTRVAFILQFCSMRQVSLSGMLRHPSPIASWRAAACPRHGVRAWVLGSSFLREPLRLQAILNLCSLIAGNFPSPPTPWFNYAAVKSHTGIISSSMT
jgi:hypothetical protein